MKKSFTLAEMLVVMAIISVLAMLAIPTIVQTNRDKAFSDILAKTYEKIENALILNKILGLDVSSYKFSSINKDIDSKKFSEILKENLKIIKYCEQGDISCYGPSDQVGYSVRLITGAGILVNDKFRDSRDPADHHNLIIGSTFIDIDGPKGANKVGNDQFGFYTTLKGLIPMGGPNDDLVPFSRCIESNGEDYGCSAWVIVNKNMDYKHCPKVINWENKTSCD